MLGALLSFAAELATLSRLFYVVSGAQSAWLRLIALIIGNGVESVINPSARKRLCGIFGLDPDTGEAPTGYGGKSENSFRHDFLLPAYLGFSGT